MFRVRYTAAASLAAAALVLMAPAAIAKKPSKKDQIHALEAREAALQRAIRRARQEQAQTAAYLVNARGVTRTRSARWAEKVEAYRVREQAARAAADEQEEAYTAEAEEVKHLEHVVECAVRVVRDGGTAGEALTMIDLRQRWTTCLEEEAEEEPEAVIEARPTVTRDTRIQTLYGIPISELGASVNQEM